VNQSGLSILLDINENARVYMSYVYIIDNYWFLMYRIE